MSTVRPVGLYSISVRGLQVPSLLAWAAAEGIGFVHLRGGPQGFALADRDTATLRSWRRAVEDTVPITGVTADVDLADLLTDDLQTQREAREEVLRLASAASVLGAGWVRLLARAPLAAGGARTWRESRLPDTAVPLLVELHHPQWLHPGTFAVMDGLLRRCSKLRLLADTAQLASALAARGEHARAVLARSVAWTEVLHLSDNGEGLHTLGHAAVAQLAAGRIAAGHPLEVAVEWTGDDRSPHVCLARYRSAAAWWDQIRQCTRCPR